MVDSVRSGHFSVRSKHTFTSGVSAECIHSTVRSAFYSRSCDAKYACTHGFVVLQKNNISHGLTQRAIIVCPCVLVACLRGDYVIYRLQIQSLATLVVAGRKVSEYNRKMCSIPLPNYSSEKHT